MITMNTIKKISVLAVIAALASQAIAGQDKLVLSFSSKHARTFMPLVERALKGFGAGGSQDLGRASVVVPAKYYARARKKLKIALSKVKLPYKLY